MLLRNCLARRLHKVKYCFRRSVYAPAQANEVTVPLERIRNIGISAHIDSGKTTVTERILYYGGRINEMHEVKGKDEVGATMDFMELERQRGITIQSAATFINWKGTHINIIDTPGHIDFTVEVERALRVLDGAVLVVCGVAGVQSQTLTVNRQLTRYNVPFITFINKLDRTSANHVRALDSLRKKLGHNCAFVTLPIGLESSLKGLIDVINTKALYFEGEQGESIREGEIPADMLQETKERRAELIACVSDADDQLAELFLNDKPVSTEDLIRGIRRAVIARKFSPVFVGTALKNKGVQPVLDGVVSYLPNPSEVSNFANAEKTDGSLEKLKLSSERSDEKPFVGMAFKLEAGIFGQLTYFRVYQGRLAKGDKITNTRDQKSIKVSRLVRMHASEMQDINVAYAGDICATFGVDCASGDTYVKPDSRRLFMEAIFVPDPVISMSIKPVSSDQRATANFLKALTRFTKEDPTYRRIYNNESKETVVSGMGELHLEIYAQRMESEYDCPVVLGKPKVAFRETILEPYNFDYWHRQQVGGAGQYGRVIGVIEPLPPERFLDVQFSNELIGNAVPRQFLPAIEKGFADALQRGPFIDAVVTGIHIRLQDGASHVVDSNERAFFTAAKQAMITAYNFGLWTVIEPIMLVEIFFPKQHLAEVTDSIVNREGIVCTRDLLEEYYTLTVEVPLNKMFGYATELRKLTEGRGEFTMEYKRYAPISSAAREELAREKEQEANPDAAKVTKKATKKN